MMKLKNFDFTYFTFQLVYYDLIEGLDTGYGKVWQREVRYLLKWIQRFSNSRHIIAGCASRVPEKGTVGASGDLAPLAHLALGLMGEGQMWGPKTGWADAGMVRKA